MRPNIILLVALITVSAGVLAAGCVTPGENVTQPTTAPAATATPAITETATPLETATSPATEMTTAETPSTTTVAATTTTVAATTTPTVTNTTTPAATTTTVAAGGTATVDLSAKNIAFDKSTITVPAGADVTVDFDNEDDGIPHNFAVYTDSSATDTIFSGETITGPDTTTYTFTAPSDPVPTTSAATSTLSR
ncbi:MAG: hypothetical protein RQM90_02270 [Methanoculleus sp.]